MKCHCNEINEFATTVGPDELTEAGTLLSNEMEMLMREDIEFHEREDGQ